MGETDQSDRSRGGVQIASGDSTPGSAAGPAPVTPLIPEHDLICRIGGGSYGEVWLARSVLGTCRAVKIVHRRSFEERTAFEREFNGLQKFEPISRTHEGLVDILQVGRTEDCLYYVMELADDGGLPLDEGAQVSGSSPSRAPTGSTSLPGPGVVETLVRSAGSYRPRTLCGDLRQRGRLPVEECLAIGLRLTSALAHLHGHGRAHRVAMAHLSRMHLDKGVALMEEGDLFGALLRLSKALELGPGDAPTT